MCFQASPSLRRRWKTVKGELQSACSAYSSGLRLYAAQMRCTRVITWRHKQDRSENSNIAAFLLKVFEHEISWVYRVSTLFQAGKAVIHRKWSMHTHTHTHAHWVVRIYHSVVICDSGFCIEWVRTQHKVILGYSAMCRNVIMSLLKTRITAMLTAKSPCSSALS